mgnify:CR=1 FL=1|jgi:hypothetical protein
MYLCRSAMVAHVLWSGFWEAWVTGAKKSALKDHAVRHRCPFITSDRLKPTDYALGQILLSDGNRSGWAATQYYALYIDQTGP